MTSRFAKNLHEAVFFAVKRQKREGGFGATPRLPATLEDTFHALRIVDAVEQYCGLPNGVSINKKTHTKFLTDFLKNWNSRTAKGVYHLTWCLKWCGVTNLDKILTEKERNEVCKTQENLYYFLKIARLLNWHEHETCDREKLFNIVSFKGILFRRWTAIFINAATEAGLFDMNKAYNWILACRNYDGGFGFLPGSTSYLENSHYALMALKILGKGLDEPEETTNFVLGCQTGAGGFSRRAGAAPFLDATWHGSASLIALAKQESKMHS